MDILLPWPRMILIADELRSLIELKYRSPHQLPGMHPLGDDSGMDVHAQQVYRIVPTVR